MDKPTQIKTAITDLFGIDYPIIAAPMFLISDSTLTIAVCRAGGSAAMPALNFRPLAALRREIQKVKNATQAPFGINIIVQDSNKDRDLQVDICLTEKVAYLITSLGDPSSIIKRAHANGTKVFCDVVSIKHARKAVDAGADGLVAIACGAGGHSGTVSPFALIPGLKDKFQIPVIAGGSIVDGRSMLAAFALGADAVYLGTRFIASHEATTDLQYKDALVQSTSDDVVNTDRVDGFPGNFIRTEALASLLKNERFLEKVFRLSPRFDKVWRLLKASKTLLGDPKKLKASYKTVYSAGHGVELIHEVKNVETIILSLAAEYIKAKSHLP